MNRQLFEQVRDSYKTLSAAGKPGRIIHLITEQIGLTDGNGKRYRSRATGNHRLAEKPKRSAEDFSPSVLAEALIGRDWKQAIGFDSDNETVSVPRLLRFQEEGAAPIGPSVFANVAAWTAAVGGLMQAQFIEGFNQAPYDLLGLWPTKKPIFYQGGERYIDIIGPADPAPEVGVGAEHPDMSMTALWVEPGQMKKYGGKILVARETAAIDISGGLILQKAKTGGDTCAFRENELILDIVCGQTNNFRMGFRDDSGATGYNTYGPTITNPAGTARQIPNDIVNPLNDLGALQISDLQMANLYHPITDNPIEVKMDVCLLPTPLADWGNWLLGMENMTALNQTTAGPAQAAPGTFPNSMQQGRNPWQRVLKPVVSRWLHYRHVGSTTATSTNRSPGLGLSGAAVYRWYRVDPARFMYRRCAWEPTSLDLNPGDYQMAVQNIIAGQVFNVSVQYQVVNPWAIQRNKSA